MLLSALLVAPGTCFGASAAPADEATRLFASLKGSVPQVRVINRATGYKSAFGSGFWVSPDGFLITNFHVIADLVFKPERYEATYALQDGGTGRLQLYAIDVVHDLALLKAATGRTSPFKFAAEAPQHGARLYSLGNPEDLGLSIVEGTHNGDTASSFHEQMHFTGAVNSGMSGGPVVNGRGEVVGINVAGLVDGDLMSFLVPAKHAIALVKRANRDNSKREGFLALVRDQLVANQAAYLGELSAAVSSSESLGNYRVPGQLSPFMQCTGDSDEGEDSLVTRAYRKCSTSGDIYLSDEQSAGRISYIHELYRSRGLGRWRFHNFLEADFTEEPTISLGGDEAMVTNYACETGFVEHQGTLYKTVFCLRAYRQLEGLYDAYLSAIVLNGDGEALRTTLGLSGVTQEGATQFARTYLEHVKWDNRSR